MGRGSGSDDIPRPALMGEIGEVTPGREILFSTLSGTTGLMGLFCVSK
jgi:hypothetical protein